MMNLVLSVRSEALKIKRTAALYLALIAAAVMPLIWLLDYSNDEVSIASLKGDPWNQFFREGLQSLGFVLLPYFIILICTLLPQIEYRNNTWKQVHASPQSDGSVFFSKFILIHLLIFLFILVYNILMAVTLVGIQLANPALGLFEHSIDWYKWIEGSAKAYLSVLAISTVQFWLGLRFRNFVVPIAMGVALWIASALLLFEYHWANVDLYPYAYPLMHVLPKYSAVVPALLTKSIIYSCIFLLLAFADFSGRKRKG